VLRDQDLTWGLLRHVVPRNDKGGALGETPRPARKQDYFPIEETRLHGYSENWQAGFCSACHKVHPGDLYGGIYAGYGLG